MRNVSGSSKTYRKYNVISSELSTIPENIHLASEVREISRVLRFKEACLTPEVVLLLPEYKCKSRKISK